MNHPKSMFQLSGVHYIHPEPAKPAGNQLRIMELHIFADKNGADAIAPGTYTGRIAPFFTMLVVQKQSTRS